MATAKPSKTWHRCSVIPSIQARAKELRLELLNSSRLKAHFEAHPGDLALLRHDKPLHRAPPPAHLKHLPAYLKDPDTAAVQQDGSTRRGAPCLLPASFRGFDLNSWQP